MSSSEILQPCPFCRATERIHMHRVGVDIAIADQIRLVERSTGGAYIGLAVYCENCKAYGPAHATSEGAAAAWNGVLHSHVGPPGAHDADPEWLEANDANFRDVARTLHLTGYTPARIRSVAAIVERIVQHVEARRARTDRHV